MKKVKIKINGRIRSFYVEDGLADLIEKIDMEEIEQDRKIKKREIPIRDISRHRWNEIALQSYHEQESNN